MDRGKRGKPLTQETYLKTFSRAVRWRLPPQESEEAISDYRELIFQPERDEGKLAEELGDPVQAAHLLTDVRTYRRWLKLFAVLAFGLFLIVEWVWTGHYSFTFAVLRAWWYPVLVMAVGLPLSLYWFRRHGQKNGPLPRRLVLLLAAVFLFGAGTLAWNWYVLSPGFLDFYHETYPDIPWQIIFHRELTINGGIACALLAFAGLVLAKCYDRRWLALYTLALTVAVLCSLLPIGAVGLIGTGVALC